ncbi:acyl carrier protein [Candidatus Saccharibacteria bacterium]|nr:acyl carrier protein [Candidatus Saccharibacteria bacterium]
MQVKNKVIDIIAETLDVDKKDITLKTNLIKDLDIESLDLVDLVGAFEEEFGVEIADKDIKDIQTVADIVEYIEDHEA